MVSSPRDMLLQKSTIACSASRLNTSRVRILVLNMVIETPIDTNLSFGLINKDTPKGLNGVCIWYLPRVLVISSILISIDAISVCLSNRSLHTRLLILPIYIMSIAVTYVLYTRIEFIFLHSYSAV